MIFELVVFGFGSVSVEQPPDFEQGREFGHVLSVHERGHPAPCQPAVVKNKLDQYVDLVWTGRVVPLFDKKVDDHFGQASQHPRKGLEPTVLLDHVEEPVTEVVQVGLPQDLGQETILAGVTVKHIYRYTSIQRSDLKARVRKIKIPGIMQQTKFL